MNRTRLIKTMFILLNFSHDKDELFYNVCVYIYSILFAKLLQVKSTNNLFKTLTVPIFLLLVNF